MKSGAFTTCISDFHLLATTFLKSCFTKDKPKSFYYRGYKNMDTVHFKDDLQKSFSL